MPALLVLLVVAATAASSLLPAPVFARQEASTPAPSASAEREGDTLLVRWTGLKAPVAVRLADHPDARWQRARAVPATIEGDMMRVPAPVAPRPYLLLRDASGRQLRVAERVLPLEGGQNFRDLGGYPAGKDRVAWGQLYRSGDPSGLTAADLTYLSKLGITTVCDFRSTSERERATSRLAAATTVITRDYEVDMQGFGTLLSSGPPTAATAQAMFIRFYRDLPFQFAADYRQMFRALAEGKAPLAFNCSAGKDRTGVAAALLLKLLGVDRETIIEDYLLSNRYYKPPAAGASEDPSLAMFRKLPPEVVKVLLAAERAYIEAALDVIDTSPGGFDAYVHKVLQLRAADIQALRSRYLRPN
ncbi:tyrosine-protein phosphatase [Thermaurantiacus sp.]